MAKSQVSQKAAAKSKAAVTKSKAKAGSLSQERIDDSDSETEVKSQPKSKTTAKASSQKSNGTAVPLRPFTAPKKTSEKPTAKPTKAAAKPAPPVVKADSEDESEDSSEEEEDESEDSEEEEDSDEELPDAPAAEAPTTNGVKRKADTQPQATNAKRVKADSTTGTSEDSSDDDDDDEDSEEADSDEKEEESAESSKAAAAPPTLSATKSKSATQSIPAKPYKPPAGYTLVESTQSPALTSLLGARSLTADKQIWHITAPADLPLSALTTLTLDAIQSGQPVLRHHDVDYVLVDQHRTSGGGATGASTHLLVPNEAGTGYTFAAQPLARRLHLQPKIVLPNLSKRQADPDKGGHVAADISQAPIVAARPQPAGLRMRWKPPGFGHGLPGRVGIDGDSDEDVDGGAAAVQFPRTLGAHAGASLPPSKGGEASAAKKSKKKKDKSTEVAAPEVNGEVKESKEEKAKRKEEKRLKKEAKRKAAEAKA